MYPDQLVLNPAQSLVLGLSGKVEVPSARRPDSGIDLRRLPEPVRRVVLQKA